MKTWKEWVELAQKECCASNMPLEQPKLNTRFKFIDGGITKIAIIKEINLEVGFMYYSIVTEPYHSYAWALLSGYWERWKFTQQKPKLIHRLRFIEC